jgi:acyl carrier protein
MKGKGGTDYLKLVEDVVKGIFIKKYEPHKPLDLEKPLRDYGVDSLDIIDLLMDIEDEMRERTKGIYSFDFPEEESPFDSTELKLQDIINYAKQKVIEIGGV